MTVLLLDLDGVLVLAPPTFRADLAAAAPWRDGGCSAFLAELADHPAQRAALVGDTDVLHAMAPLLERHAPGGEPVAVHDVFCAASVRDQEVVDLLADLAVDALHVATNQDTRRMAALAPILDGLPVDGVFASCDLGERKPEAAFFTAVLAVLGVPADDCLLVDDSPANVAGARAAGLQAVQYSSVAQLRGELAARGLVAA